MSSPVEDPPVKRERRKQARPGELLQAALELFVEKGFAATRSEEVAARAGVSKGTLFLYFPSKEELFKAVVREAMGGKIEAWNEEFERFEGSTADMLRYCLESWWERIGATPAGGLTKLMTSEAGNFPELAEDYRQQVIAPGHRLIRRILERGVARGEFHIADLDYAVYSVIAPMIFLQMNMHSHSACTPGTEPLDPLRFITQQADVLVHGFMTRPAGEAA